MNPLVPLLVAVATSLAAGSPEKSIDREAPQGAERPSTPGSGDLKPLPQNPTVAPDLVPGTPLPDPTLPQGSLVVELLDAAGKPLAHANMFVESLNATGSRRRLNAKTDSDGQIRVEGLPADGSQSIVVGYPTSGNPLISTHPFMLGAGHGMRLRLVLPEHTTDAQKVGIEHLHVVIERRDAQLRVTETWRLKTREGALFTNPAGLVLPTPLGATGLRFGDSERTRGTAELVDEGVRVTAAIPPTGLELNIVFDLPIANGRATLEQELPLRISTTQIISTWTLRSATMTAMGFDESTPMQLRSGITALVATKTDLDPGKLLVRLEGFTDGPSATRRLATLIACVLLLAVGLGWWIRSHARRAKSAGRQ